MSLIEEIKDLLKYSDDQFLQSLYRSQQEGAYCDVELCVGRDQWRIPVHRAVLAARSPYFQTMFNSDFLEKNSSVIVLDPKGEIFSTRESIDLLIQFLYTGNFSNTPGINSVIQIFRASSLWILENLQHICEYFLAANLSLENCEEILEEGKKFNSDLLVKTCLRFIFSNQDLAENFPKIVEELSNLKYSNVSENQTQYFLALHKIPQKTNLTEFIAEIKLSSGQETYKKVGVQFQVDAKGCVTVAEFNIRLPTWIDFKHFGSRRAREILDSVIVCAAAMGETCFFGIANRIRASNSNNQQYKFCGILEYHIKTEGWEIIPYIQGSIVAKYRLNDIIHQTDLLFIDHHCPNGPKLKIKNLDIDCLFVRSLEEEAIIVEQILPLESFHDRFDEDQIEDLHCQNIFMVNGDTFFQVDLILVKIDSEDNIQKIPLLSESSSAPVLSAHCLPLPDSGSFLVILKLSRNHRAGLEARIFHLEDGYLTISQPEDRAYCDRDQLHLLTDQDDGKIYLIGKLDESESSKFGINMYTADTDTWTFNCLETVPALDDQKLYTSQFPIFT